MSFCRKAKELKSIAELGLSEKSYALVRDMTPEELILMVRNSTITDFLNDTEDDYDGPEEECDNAWRCYQRELWEIKDALIISGFIRFDLEETWIPEIYFVDQYVHPLRLIELPAEICKPYYFSNRVYEEYTFSYERLRRILDVLKNELSHKQYAAVKSDIMCFERYCDPSPTLRQAKIALVQCRNEIAPQIENIWGANQKLEPIL